MEAGKSKLKNALIFLRKYIWWTVGVILLSGSIILFGWRQHYSYGSAIDSVRFQDYGTFIGGVLTYVTFILLIFTYNLQKKELKIAKKEAKQLKRTIAIQRLSNTFFELIKIHDRVIDKLNLDGFSGQSGFQILYERLKTSYNYGQKMNTLSSKAIHEAMKEHFERNISSLDHYHRSLTNLINYIYWAEDLNQEDKGFYVNIIKNKLEAGEAAILFYFVLFKLDKKTKDLFDTYDFFSVLDIHRLLHTIHNDYYKNIPNRYWSDQAI
jgi:hypothetical protein